MMTLSEVLQDCRLIIPEIILVVTLCVVVLADVVLPRRHSPLTGWIVLAGLTLALSVLLMGYDFARAEFVFSSIGQDSGGPQYGFSRMIVVDKLSDFFKVIFILGTIGVVIFSMRSVELKDYRHGEYYTLLLASVLGGAFMVSSNNFLMLVLALETLSMSSYVLVGYLKHNRLSAEASLKYVLYGAVASGVMLFGVSYIYGMAGTLEINQALLGIAMNEDSGIAVLMAFVLVIAGLGFKMAAVPFHFWCPDVYQGAPTPITAFLAVVSQAAGFSALLRVLLPLFAVEGTFIPDDVLAIRGSLLAVIEMAHLPLLFWILSVATMTLGNLVAIRQTDIKRLLAYSSIAHAGYLLMGLTVFNNDALEAMLFYFAVYLFMNLGAFLVVIVVMNKTGSSDLAAYRGLAWRNPFLFIMMFVFLISLTGLPPTAGFIGKLKLFEVIVGAGTSAGGTAFTSESLFYYSLAIIGALNTAVSLYYYMKVAKIMAFERPDEEGDFPVGLFDRAYLLVYFIPVMFLIIEFGPLLDMITLFQR